MNRVITFLAVCALISSSSAVYARANGGSVKGTVASTTKPIEAATISLLKAKDSSLVKMALTSKNGRFEVEKIVDGKYLVAVTAVGYNKYFTEAFEIGETAPSYTVKAIFLSAAFKALKNVTVSSTKAFVEQRLDKMLINVDASPTNVGLTAMEVLEKSPGISVDKDGNISLKGKEGVIVMVDGKPTYLSSQDLANMLKSMPASHLEQIEIMTNPSAKYDASGNSGIINIKTKKNKAIGFNGGLTVGGGYGFYPKTNNSINLNYRNGKFNVFGNYSHNWGKSYQDLQLTRRFSDTVFEQHTPMKNVFQSHTLKIGADYYLSKKTTIGIVLSGFENTGNKRNDNTTLIKDKAGKLATQTNAHNLVADKFRNGSVNLNLRHVLDSAGRELTADIDYVKYDKKNSQSLSNFFFNNAGIKNRDDEFINGNLPAQINIYSAKIDYTHPLQGDAKLEAGAKTSFVETDNNAQYANLTGNTWVADAGKSNHFLYKENINAAYINGSKQFNKKWSGQLGIRVEHTNAKGYQLTTGENFNRNYAQLFPTAYISYVADKKNTFSVNYGRRINRPNYQSLNPFYYFLDKYTYEVGNPYLKPQFSHNVELNHSFKGFLNSSLYYSRTTDIIQDVLDQVDSINTTFVKKSNIANKASVGFSTSLNMPVAKWWRTNIYANVYNNHFEGLVNGGNLSVSGTTFMTNISNQFTFKKGWSGEVSGFYRTKGVEGIMVARGMGAVNAGMSKQVLKNKGTLRINVRDIFKMQKFNGYSRYQNIDLKIRNQWDNRVVNVSFTYRFGKTFQNAPQRKKGGAGDEQSRVGGGSSN